MMCSYAEKGETFYYICGYDGDICRNPYYPCDYECKEHIIIHDNKIDDREEAQ